MTATRSDIIVIGGGMAGISAAALLAAEASVSVLEAEPHVGHHSTGRSAAVFIRNYGSPVLRTLNAASASAFERCIASLQAQGDAEVLFAAW